MSNSVPAETIEAFARTICAEAHKYGFETIDVVRLINAMMDQVTDADDPVSEALRTRPAGGAFDACRYLSATIRQTANPSG